MPGNFRRSVERFTGWDEALASGARTMGLRLEPDIVAQFRTYASMLQKWGSRINLTSRLEPADIISLHFLDSLALLAVRPPGHDSRIADIGSGAGFPGIPLAIVRPDLAVDLIEASAKKAAFCAAVIDRLGLTRVATVRGRAEAAMAETGHDWTVSRAAAPLPSLLRLGTATTRPGGMLAAWKGPGEAFPEDAEKLSAAWEYAGEKMVAVPGRPTPRALYFFRRREG